MQDTVTKKARQKDLATAESIAEFAREHGWFAEVNSNGFHIESHRKAAFSGERCATVKGTFNDMLGFDLSIGEAGSLGTTLVVFRGTRIDPFWKDQPMWKVDSLESLREIISADDPMAEIKA